jgi:hypothetical protein
MLTLFKPWRTGKDLKSDKYSWDETFTDHTFSTSQMKLMQNFNIRYECNDARDDYSTQLKQGSVTGGTFPQWMSSEIMQELDSDMHQGDDFGDDVAADHAVSQYSSLGPHGKYLEAQMAAIENGVRSAGWLDESPDGLSDIRTTQLETASQPSQTWKAAVQIKRQEVLAERNRNIPHTSNKSHKDTNENNAAIIDQSYLTHNFKAESHARMVIEQSVTGWQLNKEQDRAFRIIANHAVSSET